MSFRFSNSLTASLKQRMLLQRGLDRLRSQTFVGTCGAITVTMDAYCRVSRIEAAAAAAADAPPHVQARVAALRATVVDAATGAVNGPALAQAVQAACWEAHRKVTDAKAEAWRAATDQCPELMEHQSFSRWFAADASGGAIPPHANRALRDGDSLDWLGDVREWLPTAGIEGAVSSGIVDVAAARARGEVEPALLPALLAVDAPSFVIGGPPSEACPDDAGLQPAAEAAAERRAVEDQRIEMALDEATFWERVDLIRRSQTNTRDGGAKREYKTDTTGSPGTWDDKVELRFSSDYKL